MSESESNLFIRSTLQMKGERVDKVLARLLPEYTRNTIQQWIRQGLVRVNGESAKQKFKLSGEETLEIQIPCPPVVDCLPEPIDLEILDQDDQILIIDKPCGLVVHPGAGNPNGTLQNGLIYHNPELAKLPRAGIVHRLDKDTTGLMVVAKTEQARQHLIAQLDSRQMSRQYLAVVNGVMISGETINQPIGRHHQDRLRMSVTPQGKTAITHFRVKRKYRHHCLVQASLESGRTHQIRVHLSWRGFPIIGDRLYGQRNRLPPGASEPFKHCLQTFGRQALHAEKLTLIHPRNNSEASWRSELPEDMKTLMAQLEDDNARNNQ